MLIENYISNCLFYSLDSPMHISVSFPNHLPSVDSLIIEKKLSEGNFEVYQVSSPTLKTKYALKVFPNNDFCSEQYTKEKLSLALNHPNIIQSIPVTCHHKEFNIHLTELARHGDFVEIVNSGVLYKNNVLIRTYFKQLIEGLDHIHSQGVAHLDLKLENLMMGSDFMLKIIDFDHAQLITDGKITSKGTEVYRAPEVLNGTCQDLTAADIYSAGVILYTLKAGEYPFVEVHDKEGRSRRYSGGFDKDSGRFWRKKAEAKGDSDFFSEEFKELINGMLAKDPKKRFTMVDVKKSKWFNDRVLKTQTLKISMKASLAQRVIDEWNTQHQEWKEEFNRELEGSKAVKVCCI